MSGSSSNEHIDLKPMPSNHHNTRNGAKQRSPGEEDYGNSDADGCVGINGNAPSELSSSNGNPPKCDVNVNGGSVSVACSTRATGVGNNRAHVKESWCKLTVPAEPPNTYEAHPSVIYQPSLDEKTSTRERRDVHEQISVRNNDIQPIESKGQISNSDRLESKRTTPGNGFNVEDINASNSRDVTRKITKRITGKRISESKVKLYQNARSNNDIVGDKHISVFARNERITSKKDYLEKNSSNQVQRIRKNSNKYQNNKINSNNEYSEQILSKYSNIELTKTDKALRRIHESSDDAFAKRRRSHEVAEVTYDPIPSDVRTWKTYPLEDGDGVEIDGAVNSNTRVRLATPTSPIFSRSTSPNGHRVYRTAGYEAYRCPTRTVALDPAASNYNLEKDDCDRDKGLKLRQESSSKTLQSIKRYVGNEALNSGGIYNMVPIKQDGDADVNHSKFELSGPRSSKQHRDFLAKYARKQPVLENKIKADKSGSAITLRRVKDSDTSKDLGQPCGVDRVSADGRGGDSNRNERKEKIKRGLSRRVTVTRTANDDELCNASGHPMTQSAVNSRRSPYKINSDVFNSSGNDSRHCQPVVTVSHEPLSTHEPLKQSEKLVGRARSLHVRPSHAYHSEYVSKLTTTSTTNRRATCIQPTSDTTLPVPRGGNAQVVVNGKRHGSVISKLAGNSEFQGNHGNRKQKENNGSESYYPRTPRPAFYFFSREKRLFDHCSLGQLTRRQMRTYSLELADEWQAMVPDRKLYYKKLAAKDKRRFDMQLTKIIE